MKTYVKNRTSSVPADRTAARIEELLVKAGASNVSKQYKDGGLVGFDFTINVGFGVMLFRMPINADAAYDVMLKERKRYPDSASRKALREQANKTAWKVAQEWIEIQLTMVAMKQAELAQVFLPYAVNHEDKPLFQVFKDQKFAALLPPAKGGDSDSVEGEVVN